MHTSSRRDQRKENHHISELHSALPDKRQILYAPRPTWKIKSVKLITSVQCISRSDPSNPAAEGSPDGATPCPLTPTSSLIHSRAGDSGVPPPPLTYSRAFTNKGVPLNFEITMQPPIPRDAFKGFPPDLLDNIEASTSRLQQNWMEVHPCHHHRGGFRLKMSRPCLQRKTHITFTFCFMLYYLLRVSYPYSFHRN